MFKRFYIDSSGTPLIQRSGTICATLDENFMGNTRGKYFLIWTSGSIGVVI